MKAVNPEHIDATHCSQIAKREGSLKILLLPLFAKVHLVVSMLRVVR